MRSFILTLVSAMLLCDCSSADSSSRQIFGHMIRVQRGTAERPHNHRFQHHHGERNKGDRRVAKCPPPMSRIPENACTVDPCLSDSECKKHGQKCCYNGCLYACVHVVQPPPVIDWQTSAKETENETITSDSEYEGNLEFDIIPGEMLAESHRGEPIGEICSTTVEEDDILMDCPHGYICHIEDQGDPTTGVPDRGRCVKVDENAAVNIAVLQDEYFY